MEDTLQKQLEDGRWGLSQSLGAGSGAGQPRPGNLWVDRSSVYPPCTGKYEGRWLEMSELWEMKG